MSNLENEPSLEKIDDYNNNESPQKRRTIWSVIVFCLVVGAFFSYLRTSPSTSDYVGTEEKPGINTSKR